MYFCLPSVKFGLQFSHWQAAILSPGICNSIETKAKNNKLEAKQYPAIQRNLTENTIDSGTRSKTPLLTFQIAKITYFRTAWIDKHSSKYWNFREDFV
jgi:hypothetical protein